MEALTVVIGTEAKEIIKVFHDAANFVAKPGLITHGISKSSTNPFWGDLLSIIKTLLDGVEDLKEVTKPKGAGKDRVGGSKALEKSGPNMG